MNLKIEPFQDERPWGYFRQFCKNESVTVKILSLKPYEMFSLQKHSKREEFWRVISGTGFVTIEEDKRGIKIGDEIIIPLETKHRLEGGPTGLEVMEISFGDFDEDDIVRYEDKYHRI